MSSVVQLMYAVNGRFHVLNNMLSKEMSHTQVSDIVHALGQLPIIETTMLVKGWWEGEDTEGKRSVPINPAARSSDWKEESEWVKVHAEQDYVLKVNLTRPDGTKSKV